MDHPYRQIELQAYELCDKWRYQRLSLVGEHLCVLPVFLQIRYGRCSNSTKILFFRFTLSLSAYCFLTNYQPRPSYPPPAKLVPSTQKSYKMFFQNVTHSVSRSVMMAMAFILIITTLFNIAARMHEMQNHGTKTSPHLPLLQHISHIVTTLSLSS
jgi:hypothetical protein